MTVQTNKFIGLDLKQLLLASSIMGFSSISNAALFDCVSEPGTCIGEGDTVIFKYAGTSSTMGLFGTIEVIGDSIVSFPTDFRAESLNGLSGVGGSVSVNDNGAVQVIAKDGYQINSINILERGDYLLSGAGSAVDVDGWSDVWDWNDVISGPDSTAVTNGYR